MKEEDDRPDAMVRRGVKAEKEWRGFEEVLSCYDAALRVDEAHVPALIHRSQHYRRYRMHDKALKDAERAVSLAPSDAEAWYQKGLCLKVMGKRDDALQALERCTSLNEVHMHAWVNLGVLYMEKKDFEKARECAERALAVDPELGSALTLKKAAEGVVPSASPGRGR